MSELKNELIKQIKANAPLLKECMEKYDDYTLKEYFKVIKHKDVEEIESSKDLICAVKNYLSEFIEYDLVEKIANQILNQKIILTANHHEVEFCVQSVQGNILYDKYLESIKINSNLVPIFSNTTVNMSNSNFPRGVMIYDTNNFNILKVPIFPFKQRNNLVYASSPFTKEMVNNSIKVLDREFRKNNIDKNIYEVTREILLNEFLDDKILNQNRYTKQAVLLNQRLGHKFYKHNKKEFIYIELEEISKQLLINDMNKKSNLTYKLLFDKKMRMELMKNLNGQVGCWNNNLEDFLKNPSGTHFFWGIDEKQRRFSLFLDEENLIMYGIDMDGNKITYEFSEDSLRQLLLERKIVLGLFLTFFEICMLRNFTMIGGCFQGEYLRIMQEGIIKTLKKFEGFQKEIDSISEKICSFYLSGPMIFTANKNNYSYPMSTMEIINYKGLEDEQIENLLNMKLSKAHQIGIYNFYIDLIKKNEQIHNWWEELSLEMEATV